MIPTTSNASPMSDLGVHMLKNNWREHVESRARWYSARWRFWAVLAGAVFALVAR